MKRYYICAFLLFLLCYETYAKKQKDETYFYPFISIGYPYTNTGDLNDYYNSIVNSYRSQGVPISTQVEFGRTLVVGGGVLYNFKNDTRLGISLGYWYSPAYSGYEDYGGTLKINGSLNDLDICLMLQTMIDQIENYPVVIDIRVGGCRSSLGITQDVRFNSFSENNSNVNFSKVCWGPCFELTIGSRFEFGGLIFSPEVGYRLTSNKLPKLPSENSNGIGSVSDEFNISESGVVFLLSIGTKF